MAFIVYTNELIEILEIQNSLSFTPVATDFKSFTIF